MKKPPLRSFRTENFKAIRDSGRVAFGWLTVFIGNNGVGKSSLIEGLETFRDVVSGGVDTAFRRWHGFEYVSNNSRRREVVGRVDRKESYSHPLQFQLEWGLRGSSTRCKQTINRGPGGNALFIQREEILGHSRGETTGWLRDDAGQVSLRDKGSLPKHASLVPGPGLADGESLFRRIAWDTFEAWQFLMLNPDRMGQPTPQQRAVTGVRLAKDGANIAEYLNEIRNLDLGAFDGILEALRYVLPYSADLQPILTSELERAFYLKMKEATFDVPGWLLSTGTLRIVALLACLRHPKPPPLLIVEEIENGLDPRTLHLLVEEIRAAITAGRTQVILTTHSPFLLDLLDLTHIIVVEREEGQPVFRRPDAAQLGEWSKTFSPGRLYTMGRLTRND